MVTHENSAFEQRGIFIVSQLPDRTETSFIVSIQLFASSKVVSLGAYCEPDNQGIVFQYNSDDVTVY